MQTNLRSLLVDMLIKNHVDKFPLRSVLSLDSKVSCLEAVEAMKSQKIDCVLVKDQKSPLAGIFTVRDVLTKVWRNPKALSDIQLCDVMTRDPQHLKYHASVAKAVYLMDIGGFRHIPVLVENNLHKIISIADFMKFVSSKVTRFLEKIENSGPLAATAQTDSLWGFFTGDLSILQPSPPVLLSADCTVSQAVTAMLDHRTGSVVIGDSAKRSIKGIFTEKDLLRDLVVLRNQASSMRLEDRMTRSPVTLQPSTSVLYAFEAMNEGEFNHIPIVDFSEQIIGVLSSKNFIRFINGRILAELQANQ